MIKKEDILEFLKIVILAGIIVLPVRYFLFQPFLVLGTSMEPNFSQKDYLLVDELSYRLRQPERGEVVVLKPPTSSAPLFYIKRIIGLPGETIKIQNGKVIIKKNGEEEILDESPYLTRGITTSGNLEITLGENKYFVLGDNRANSVDSRVFGAVPKENISGRPFLRAFPFAEFQTIKAPSY